MDEFMVALGRRLKAARERRGLSLREVAEAAGGYVTNLSSYENGRRIPSLELFDRIARTLGVSSDYLLGGDAEGNFLIDAGVKEAVIKLAELSPRNRELALEIIEVVCRMQKSQSSE